MSEPPNISGTEEVKNEDTVVQLYWALFEVWSAQVDSYWTRTNYFGAFELAAIAGSWVLLDDSEVRGFHLVVAFMLTTVVAIALTSAWIFSNLKSYDYLRYWWGVLQEIEADNRWVIAKSPKYVTKHEDHRNRSPALARFWLLKNRSYHDFTNWDVPCGFGVVWMLLIGFLLWMRFRP